MRKQTFVLVQVPTVDDDDRVVQAIEVTRDELRKRVAADAVHPWQALGVLDGKLRLPFEAGSVDNGLGLWGSWLRIGRRTSIGLSTRSSASTHLHKDDSMSKW